MKQGLSKKRGSRRRGGWRIVGRKIQAYVRLHHEDPAIIGAPGLATRMFDLGTSAETMRRWIDDTVLEHRRRHPRGARGTLEADVHRYLALLVDRPKLQAERRRQLRWWCAEFGTRSRGSLQPIELKTALKILTAKGVAASTVRHVRTALFNLFTELDGKNAPNPLRDVAPPAQPDPLPRAIPFAIIDRIFEAMPDRRYARKLTAEDVRIIRAKMARRGSNASAVARTHGISETLVRKIREPRRRADRASMAKARLQVMAYVGLPPAIIMLITPPDIDLEGASVLVQGRAKGKRTRPARLPLTPSGVEALRAFIAAEAFGPFSTSSVRQVFRRAITTMCRRLEMDPQTKTLGAKLREQLRDARPYDLRHSFLTAFQLAGRNINATRSMALHADERQTKRYTLAAVTPELRAAADALSQVQGQQPFSNQIRSEMS